MEADTMKTFDKSSKLDNVLYDVRGPVVDERPEWKRWSQYSETEYR